MARTLTPRDGYTLVNALVRQLTGQDAQAVVNASDFVSAGETVMAYSKTNILNALTMVIGRTFAAVRPYNAKMWMVNAINTGVYSHRLRKLSFYADDALPSGYFNTNANTNFQRGFTAGANGGTSTPSQWEQHPQRVVEVNFGGSTTWQDCYSWYEDKLEVAFRSVEDFNILVEGFLTEKGNDIESQKEAWNRMTVLSCIAQRYYLQANSLANNTAINLTSAFNTHFGTSYTTFQLQTTYLKDFLEFMVTVIKMTMERFTERSTEFHDPLQVTDGGVNYHILRHTPYDKQRLILYNPLFRMAESMVMPEIFRPEYLDINKQFEKVEYWQSNDTEAHRSAINFHGAYLDTVTGTQKDTGAVQLDYVVGILYDEDAMMTDFQLEKVNTTELEARKGFRNTWYTFAKNSIIDQTEKAVIFYMAD